MDKYIGKRLDGRYEIRELIGVGGMANVYNAYDVLEKRIVAGQNPPEEYMDNDEFMRRFRNESRAISLLDHPNIVKVYDVIFSNRIQSIVMEYIDGITLKDYIDQEHVLRWKEAVHFTVQILKALQHAHDKGITIAISSRTTSCCYLMVRSKLPILALRVFPEAIPRPLPIRQLVRYTILARNRQAEHLPMPAAISILWAL